MLFNLNVVVFCLHFYYLCHSFKGPPTEETLMQNTLWPEVQKLYGHGYEVFAITSTADGKVLASSCRATNEEHAQIILWDTTTWKQIQKLPAHQLTVTQMKFSPNDRWLLSVSRDRRWTLFEAANDDDADDVSDKTRPATACNYKMVACTDKKNGIHSRIIWTCDWTHDSRRFATGSRDGKIVAWQKCDSDAGNSLKHHRALCTLELQKTDSITAIAFAKTFAQNDANGDYLAAIGLETGHIHIATLNADWTILFTIDQRYVSILTSSVVLFINTCDFSLISAMHTI